MMDQTPLMVTRYLDEGTAKFLPVSRTEMARAAAAYQKLLSTFDVEPGRFLLVVSTLEDGALFAPLEMAATELALKLANADASIFEASRIEAIIRHFDVAIVAGVTTEVLDGLQEIGHDPRQLFAGKVIWARGEAYVRLNDIPGARIRRWLDLGPAAALGCVEQRGAHVDSAEWDMAEQDGRIFLSNRLPRLLAFSDFDTGVQGHVELTPCTCGFAGARLMPTDVRP